MIDGKSISKFFCRVHNEILYKKKKQDDLPYTCYENKNTFPTSDFECNKLLFIPVRGF